MSRRDQIASPGRTCKRSFRELLLAPIFVALSACAVIEIGSLPAEPTGIEISPPEIAVPAALPLPGLSPEERVQRAIALLQQDDAAKAKAELEAALAEQPDYEMARSLIRQIETPLDVLFPSESFQVRVQRNQTLATLAEIYLGDPLLWVALARYNGIARPSRIIAGQTVLIPETEQARAAETRLTEIRAWANVRQYTNTGRFLAAIREAETHRLQPDAAQAALLASAYRGYADLIRPRSPQNAAQAALDAGQLYLTRARRPDDAFEALSLAVLLDPNLREAASLLETAKKQSADMHFAEGTRAIEQGEYERAVAVLDRALAMDPARAEVQTARLRAFELRQAAGARAARIAQENAVKADYLSKLARFVRWPERAFANAQSPIRLCVVGADPFGPSLDRAVFAQRVGDRMIELARNPVAAKEQGCHVLYAGGSAAQSVPDAIAAVKETPVLTVTEGAASGGIVQFVSEREQIRFRVDNEAAAENGIALTSQLLDLGAAR